MAKLLILGAGGHGKVVAEVACLSKEWDEISFLDNDESKSRLDWYPVVGKLDEFVTLRDKYDYAFVAIGDNLLRMRYIKLLMECGYKLPTLIHPTAVVSENTKIGEGTMICVNSVINTGTVIGQGCIINTSSSIDHCCKIGDGVHISPGVNIGGTVTIDNYSWICIGSNVSNDIKIGNHSIISAGAVVLDDVESDVLVGGIPAEFIKHL
ncbi:acetyltransferase [Mycoplasmatota bacterium]|nr:acetyltransferase [Mycoplasmatota bacterium]